MRASSPRPAPAPRRARAAGPRPAGPVGALHPRINAFRAHKHALLAFMRAERVYGWDDGADGVPRQRCGMTSRSNSEMPEVSYAASGK